MKCKDCGNTHPALPGFPNHVLCDYYNLHMSNIADASRCEHFMPKAITNADRIRAMSVEELAEKISGLESFALTCGGGWHPDKWLDWLKSPVEEGDNG